MNVSTEDRTDLADDLAEVYDKLSEEDAEVDADNVEEDAAEEEEAEEIEDVEESAEDEETEEGAGEPVDEVDEADEADVEETAEEDQDEDDGAAPLEHWKMEDKKYFKTLPARAREFLVERDKEFQRQASAKITEVMHIKRALEPIKEEMSKFGVSDDQAVRTLVGAHKMLVDNPKEGIKHLMGQYNLTPEALFSQDGPEDTVDPRILNLENKAAQYEQSVVAREQAMLAGRIDEFRKNAEFFDEVQGEMTQLAVAARAVNPDVAPDIEVLYNKACRLNEGVWEKLQSRKQKESGKVNANRRSENAAGAKVKPTAASKRQKAKTTGKRSMQDDLYASWDEVAERQQGTAL